MFTEPEIEECPAVAYAGKRSLVSIGLLAVSILLPALAALGAGRPGPAFAESIRGFPAPHQASFQGIAAFRGMLFTLSGPHAYRSADGGRNWVACATTGMSLPDLRLNQVDSYGSGLWMLAGRPGSGALLYSDDWGVSWRNSIPDNPDAAPHGLFSLGDTLIAYGGKLADEMGVIWYKPSQGGVWLPWGSPAGMSPVSATSFGHYIYAEFESGNARTILRARAPGTDWEKADAGLPLGLGADDTLAVPGLGFGQRSGRLYAAMDAHGVYALDSDGRTWSQDTRGFGLSSPFFFQTGKGLGMIAGDSVFVRDDASGAWTHRGVVPGRRGDIGSFAVLGDSVIAAGYKRVLVSVDEGASWRPMEIQTGVTSIANHPVSGPRAALRRSSLAAGTVIWFDSAGRPRDVRGKTR